MNWSSDDFRDKIVNTMDKIRKYKIYIIILLVISIILLFILIPKKESFEGYMELIGPSTIRIYKGNSYDELGYKIYDENNNEIKRDIEIISNLDINMVGDYEIKYKFGKIELIRNIIVLEKPSEYYNIKLNEVDGEETIYLRLNDEYSEPGYKILDHNGSDVTDKIEVKIEEKIDTTQKGNYVVIYEFTDLNNLTTITKRNVVVLENKLEIDYDKTYTNTYVTLNINVEDEYFDYIELPNGEKIDQENYKYNIEQNGIYTIKLYNKKGLNIEKEIEINNIDKEAPTGSCTAVVTEGQTKVNIKSNDNIGISHYIIDGKKYITKDLLLNKELKNINVEVYDNALNKIDISCLIDDKTNKLLLSSDIKEYTKNDVKISVNVESDYFDHIELPDKTWVYEKNYTYTASQNGVYDFKLYTKDGKIKEASIEINNIDKEAPTASCTAVVTDGQTKVNIKSNDNIGISHYIIDGKKYITKDITLNKELKNINVEVYDNVLNKIDISCLIDNKTNKLLLSSNIKEYTKNDVKISVNVESDYFDHIELPDKTWVYEKNYTYTASQNGVYDFKLYTNDGKIKEASIEINNIDKEAPTGSCSGSYKNGVSTVNINSSDNIGVSKYVIDGITYTSKKITLNKEYNKVNITIYDTVGNTKNISCDLQNKNELITSAPNITFSYEYKTRSDVMPYGLFTPSSANNNTPTPLIIWLHGSGEKGVNSTTFKNSGLLNILTMWEKSFGLSGFNAYVLCPHLAGNGYSGSWNNETSRSRLNTLIKKIKQEKNILDTKVILVGHSLGAQGVLYMASKDNIYSAAVVLSGYNPWVTYSNIKIPILGYVGHPNYYEDSASYNFMIGDFKRTFGSNNTFVFNVSHGYLPTAAFTQDANGDKKSDLIEWMLKQ